MTQPDLPLIPIEQLTPGLYILLDLGWLDHPFPFNQFKIKDRSQISVLKSLGLSAVRCDPGRSDCQPLLAAASSPPEANQTEVDEQAAALAAARAAKAARLARISVQRERIADCEKAFAGAAQAVKEISRNLFARPQMARESAEKLVDLMLKSLLTDRDVAIHLMNDKVAGEEVYYHSINVSVLAMLLGKEMGLGSEELRDLTLGALFHDVGKLDIPDKVLLKTEPLTNAEIALLQQHVEFGFKHAYKTGLNKPALAVVAQHHEMIDGSGYPKKLKGDAIHRLARLFALVNSYDNLCNPVDVRAALTPHEALQQLFAKERARYDPAAIATLIRCLGVYPPGTVVRLSNEGIGMVMSVNSAKPLRPAVLIYDPSVPKQEAIILDLEQEPELSIGKAIRPGQLPRPVYDYLSPRRRVTYYFDTQERTGASKR